MKTKVLLIVLLVGITCLAVYGRRRPPTPDEERQMQKQLYKQDQERRAQRQNRLDERKRRQGGVSSDRLTQLEARVANLEHALITQLTHHKKASSNLKAVLDSETALRARLGKRAVENVVHVRIAKTIESRAASESKKR